MRFKNGTENWIAFVGLQDGRPYEIFTGKIEEDAMYIPPQNHQGLYYKGTRGDGSKRYDFQYIDRYGYTNTIGGISRLFNEEFWNYAKLISGVLRHGMPISNVVSLIESLHLDSETINTWKLGVDQRSSSISSTARKPRTNARAAARRHGLSERLSYLHVLRVLEVRLMLCGSFRTLK